MLKITWNTIIAAVVLIVFISSSRGIDNCLEDPPVSMNEEFLSCCTGRPLYASENCIDSMLEKSKFSPQCLVDCMYREALIYDGETIDLNATKAFLDSQIPNEDFNLVYADAFERCSKLEKSSDRFDFLNTTNIHGCDEYPHYIDMCVWYYTVANCPKANANDNNMCKIKSEWVQQCLLSQ